MTNTLIAVTTIPHIEVDRRQQCPEPRLLNAGERVVLGRTDLIDRLLDAVINGKRLTIPQIGQDDLFPVQAVIWSVRHDPRRRLDIHVRLVASSGIQLADPRHSQSYLIVDPSTGETELRCDTVGMGVITRVSLEPAFVEGSQGSLIPTGETSLTAFVEFRDKKCRWSVDDDTYVSGDQVRVRVTESRFLVLA